MQVELYGQTYNVVSEAEASERASLEEKSRRAAWSKLFDLARETIPSKFAWIEAPKLTQDPDGKWRFPVPSGAWSERLPWLTREHLRRFFEAWRDRTNLLICGPADVGKTCLMVLHAQWTLAHASYDAAEVKTTRQTLLTWVPKSRLDSPPREPEWLTQVKEAQGLRFMSAPDLLDEKQQGPNEKRLSEAIRVSALYLDEVGREMYGAAGQGHLASGRRAAVMRLLEARWANERRFVATSEYTPEQLGDIYGAGSFRRIAGERSGATVLDLGDEQWAGAWLRSRKVKPNG